MGTDSPVNEMDGFETAMNAFAAEDGGPPEPVVEGETATVPVAEPEVPEAETPEEAAPATQEPKKPTDFVEFTTPEQKQRFNDVFGYGKRLEREIADLRQKLAQPPPQPVAPVVPQPQATSDKPKLSDFETADEWADAVSDWAASKAEQSAASRSQQEFLRQQNAQRLQAEQQQVVQYLQTKTAEGHQKYGQMAFDNVSAELANFAPPGSTMNHILFGLQRFPEVVMELGKNLQEADRIARLHPNDQIFELKTLERKLHAGEELRAKTQQKIPTKVESPGAGEDLKAGPNTAKLRQAAKASGNLRDFAKVFEADQTL